MLYGYTKTEPSFDEYVTTICCKATQKTELSFDEHEKSVCCKATQKLHYHLMNM